MVDYRAITLSSIIGEVLDWVVLIKESAALGNLHLQFGFKQGAATTQCSIVMLETISYYKYNGSNVNVFLLDVTKAFDRLHYYKLFKLFIDKGMSPIVTQLLICMYTNQDI